MKNFYVLDAIIIVDNEDGNVIAYFTNEDQPGRDVKFIWDAYSDLSEDEQADALSLYDQWRKEFNNV